MRLLVLGLDCLEPSLAFERYADAMPTLSRLREQGAWGRLRSTTPPITVPAWSCMMSGQDPGQLGIYGFRNRKDYSYEGLSFATSQSVKQPRLWDLLAEQGRPSVVVGVPQTFPPRREEIQLIAGFLAPSTDSAYTHPPALAAEVAQLAGEGGYMLDVAGFRTDDKQRLLQDIYQMSRRRFRVVRGLMQSKRWDLFMMVEMGPDRLHHGFWRYCSPTHRLYQAGNPYEQAVGDYYRYLDDEVASVLALVDEDVAVMVVSDHGAQDMQGGVCVNEWLIDKGWLTLKERPSEPTRLTPQMVDWSRTKAWGEGGYYGRVFINKQGREPQGQVAADDYDRFRDELQAALEGICDAKGQPIGTVVHRPERVYREVRNIAPDLMVYFGDLNWRSVGSVGTGGVLTESNDTGPDDANHAPDGIFMLKAPNVSPGERDGLQIYDVAPAACRLLGLKPTERMIGDSARIAPALA